MGTCRTWEEWRLAAEPDRPVPRDLEAHLAACPECRRLRGLYEGAIDGVRERVERVGRTRPSGPDMEAIRAGLAMPRRARDARSRRVVGALAVAATLVLAALGSWFVLDGAQGPVLPESPSAEPVRDPVTPPSAVVRPGQWIQTAGTETRLSDARVAEVRVGPYTHVQIGGWDPARTVLFLDEGRIDVSVRPLRAEDVFEVRTPLAQVRVVGTRFRTLHRPGMETVVRCFEGEVKVETLAEIELGRVPAGYEIRVTRDGVKGPQLAEPDTEAEGPPERLPPSILAATPPAQAPGAPLVASLRATSPGTPRVELAPPTPPGTPPAPATVLESARRRLDRAQAQEAVEEIRRALAAGTAPEPRLLALLGDALRITGRPDEARAAYERSVAGDPPDVPEGVLVDLALLLQQDLGRPRDAERTWWQYLALHPRGRHAAQALDGLAALAGDEGRGEESLALRTRLVAEHPDAPEAARALADAGRDLLARRGTEAAWAWFAARRDDPVPALAETALAGLVRVRIEERRVAEARALADEALRRFPGGPHADEIRAFLAGAPPPSERSRPWR